MPGQTGTCAEANDPSLTSGATAALSVVEQAATQGIRTLIRDEDRRLACGVPVNLHSRPDSAVVARVGGNLGGLWVAFFPSMLPLYEAQMLQATTKVRTGCHYS